MWHRRQHHFKNQCSPIKDSKAGFWIQAQQVSLANEHQRGLSKIMAVAINVSNLVFVPSSANTGLQVAINTRAWEVIIMVLLLDINDLI